MTNLPDDISFDATGKIVIGGAPPSPVREGGRRGSPLMEAADSHPGVWVSQPSSKRTNCTAYRKKGYEATVRKDANGVYTLWLRKPAPDAKP